MVFVDSHPESPCTCHRRAHPGQHGDLVAAGTASTKASTITRVPGHRQTQVQTIWPPHSPGQVPKSRIPRSHPKSLSRLCLATDAERKQKPKLPLWLSNKHQGEYRG